MDGSAASLEAMVIPAVPPPTTYVVEGGIDAWNTEGLSDIISLSSDLQEPMY